MYWYVFCDSELIFKCSDDTEGQERVIEFIIDNIANYGGRPENYIVIRGERCKFVPPSSKGELVKCVE